MSVGLVLSAPQSGAGKTMLTLGILRALNRRGVHVRSAKSGPDYIDPQFHAAATGRPCTNLDSWAMAPQEIRALAHGDEDLLIVEGAMGLHDGAPVTESPRGLGSTADIAAILGIPVNLVLDIAKQGQTAASVVLGLDGFRDDVRIAGVILNRAGSPRHAEMVSRAITDMGFPVLGWIPRLGDLDTPSRHLGLVQAHEREDLETFLEKAADIVETRL
ncbi:MAG: cobyrinate a,c-diamide synthase, partial [Rhodospirillales bacterium]|nr:cobyrinate a,c-diamide synthase [Rhodospirillales bacterium]